MIIPRVDNEIFVVGLTVGPVTESVVKALSSQDASVRVYLPEEAVQFLAAVAAHHYPLPLVVEPGYDMNSIRLLLVAALQHGVRLVPVGSQALWEQMVPLEMPELIELRVIAPEELKVQEVDENPEPEEEKEEPLDTTSETYVVNGTTVYTLFPSLRHSLADLNSSEVAVDSAVLMASSAKTMAKPSAGAKRTRNHNHTLEKILLSAVLAVCVAGIACYLIMISSDESSEAQTAPAANNTAVTPKGKKHTCPKDDAMPELMQNADSCPECRARALELHEKKHEQEGAQPDMDEGCKLACKKCELKKHRSKDHKSLSESELEEGAQLGCEECQKQLHDKKHKAKPISDFSEAELGEGDFWGCKQCRKIVHDQLHAKAGDTDLSEADVQKGLELNCPQCNIAADRQAARKAAEEEAKRKAEEESARKAAEEEAARKAAEEAARKKKVSEHKKIHTKKTPLTQKLVEEGVALDCEECLQKKKKSHDKRHKDKAKPLTDSEVAEGVKLGCDKCKKSHQQAHEVDSEFVAEATPDTAAQSDAARKAEEEAARKAEEEEAKRKAKEEAARKTEEEEAKRKAEEEEAKRKAEEEEAKRKAEDEEAKRKAEEEEAARKAEDEEAKRKAEEEEAKRKAEEEEAKRKAEEEAARKAEEETEHSTFGQDVPRRGNSLPVDLSPRNSNDSAGKKDSKTQKGLERDLIVR